MPSPVITEWWRGTNLNGRDILRTVVVEPLTKQTALLAGEAIRAVPKATAIDAIVMASAAQRGDVVYTSDLDDLEQLRAFFPGVLVLRA